ncbi:MAG: PQQ-binding-like beta-propeller repeat protein, partial [Planctomycetales bacterium]
VHGSVLVKNGELIAAAGRSSYLDGGLQLYRLDPLTGKEISKTSVFSPDPETGKQPQDPNAKDVHGALNDILSAVGDDVYMRHLKLDFKTGVQTGSGTHLFSPLGFLDDTWWHRAYWLVNDKFTSHWSGWHRDGNTSPSGRILSYDKDSIFGFGRDKYPSGNTGQWRGGEKYHLFALLRGDQAKATPPPKQPKGRRKPAPKPPKYAWTTSVPLLGKAMFATENALFVAGPPNLVKPEGTGEAALRLRNPDQVRDAWDGKKGGVLWVASVENGSKLSEYKLKSPPVFDGMAAGNGRVFIATADGKIVCFSER